MVEPPVRGPTGLTRIRLLIELLEGLERSLLQCRSLRRTRWWAVVRTAEPHRQSGGLEDEAIRSLNLRQALARLGKEDRMALYLFYYLDLPQEEVAQVMGTSTAAVKVRLHRAVRRLRPALEVEEELV